MVRENTIQPAQQVQNEYSLSYFQERMWMLNKKRPDDLSYNIPVVFLLEGELSIDVINQSLTEILRRHDTLRARFGTSSRGEPVQIITPPRPFSIPVISAKESEIPQLIEDNARHVFDLVSGPIFDGKLAAISPKRHVLLLNVHHIAADGWSIESILFSELLECYEAFSEKTAPELTPLKVQYTDFAKWQRQLDLSHGLVYWQQHLAGYESSLELPSDFLRTPKSGSTSERFEYTYSPAFSQALDKFAQQHGCTLFMALLAGFALTISRYTGKDDLCLGTTTSGRILPEIEPLIGFFINILPLRFSVDEDATVNGFMEHIRKITLAGFDHQTVPFERIVYSSAVERNDLSASLVPLVIRHQNFPRTHLEHSLPGGVKFGAYPGFEGYRTATGQNAVARCEVELSYTGDRNKLQVEVMYASDIFRPKTIEQLLRHHEQLMHEMMANGDRPLAALSMLTEPDRERLTVTFNQTERINQNPLDFTERWNLQAQKTPDAVACYDQFGSWTYREVAAAADSFAASLVKRGVKKGDIIAVCLERSAPLLASFVAVWKAGAAYVPLDPSYPETYLNLIRKDAAPQLTICTLREKNQFQLSDDECLVIDERLTALEAAPVNHQFATLQPDDLAYLMYTSGSTGTPKGVRIPHRQLITWLCGIEDLWPFGKDEVIAQKTTIAFAVSTKEIFAGPLNGAPLVFIDTESVKDTVRFVAALKASKATRVNLVPSHLLSVLTYCSNEKITLPDLRICITAGEPLTAELVTLFRSVLPQVRLINNYGCTELNDICYYDTTQFDGSQGFVPIGRPVCNSKIYVLDRRGRQVPEGVPGEVHVAGDTLALGYHRLDELTKERFTDDIFGKQPGKKLFNTGDVVRYLPDGNLEYLGRWDLQVKIRGFRVDVRHVEKILGEFEGMGTRAVVGENGKLTAFYLENSEMPVDIGRLRLFLEEKLPSYMVPTAFVALTEMPKLPNGKLNRRGLKTSGGILKQSDTYEPPSNDAERTLVEIWSEVLEVPEERIGRHANFFELGGHSLSATRLLARIKERMGIELGLSYIFEHPRLLELALHLADALKPDTSEDDIIIPKTIKQHSGSRQVQIPGLLENKVVLITGGSRGIGRTTARLLASHGASVAINYLKSNEQARMVKEIIEEDGGNAEIFQGDSTDKNQVNDMVGAVRQKFGKIDVVVANAAIGFKIAPFVDYEWGDFERKLNDELKSLFLLSKAVVPEMAERKNGSIIAVSSTMSKLAQHGYCAHSSAKAALDAFVRALANELGPDGIRINTVAPGLTLTDATANMPPQIKDAAAAKCPLRRNGLPRDVAGAVLFLASDLSQFMTGTYLPVDGGYTML